MAIQIVLRHCYLAVCADKHTVIRDVLNERLDYSVHRRSRLIGVLGMAGK